MGARRPPINRPQMYNGRSAAEMDSLHSFVTPNTGGKKAMTKAQIAAAKAKASTAPPFASSAPLNAIKPSMANAIKKSLKSPKM